MVENLMVTIDMMTFTSLLFGCIGVAIFVLLTIPLFIGICISLVIFPSKKIVYILTPLTLALVISSLSTIHIVNGTDEMIRKSFADYELKDCRCHLVDQLSSESFPEACENIHISIRPIKIGPMIRNCDRLCACEKKLKK